MCGDGKQAYRDPTLEEDIPKARTAEEIYRVFKDREEYRKKGRHSTGTDLLEDVFR